MKIMNNRLVALIAAMIVGMSLAPQVAGAEDADGPNPFTLTFANGMCSFGVNDQNPEMKLFRQDSSINRSYVFDKEVPEFAEIRAMNPKLEDKTDPAYQAQWKSVAGKLKTAGYTDGDITWLDRQLRKGLLPYPLSAVYKPGNHPISPQKAKQWIDSENKGRTQFFVSKNFRYLLGDGPQLHEYAYWLDDDHAPQPAPKLSVKIMDKGNAGFEPQLQRSRRMAGYGHDKLEECARLGQ